MRLALFTSGVETTGDGNVRIGDTVVDRDLAVAYAVRLLDAAAVAARELPPELAAEADTTRQVLAYLDRLFARHHLVRCRMENGPTARVPVVRDGPARAYARVGMTTTARLVRSRSGRSWSGMIQVWGLVLGTPAPRHDPAFRRVFAARAELEAAPNLQIQTTGRRRAALGRAP